MKISSLGSAKNSSNTIQKLKNQLNHYYGEKKYVLYELNAKSTDLKIAKNKKGDIFAFLMQKTKNDEVKKFIPKTRNGKKIVSKIGNENEDYNKIIKKLNNFITGIAKKFVFGNYDSTNENRLGKFLLNKKNQKMI